MQLAPVLLFVYKRLDALQATIKALQQNTLCAQTDLYIFSDAAKNKEDQLLIKNVRDYIDTVEGFRSVKIFHATKNKGLATSIIEGVSNILSITGKVIVLEDDLITTPNFLFFMNGALNKYEHNSEVFSVSGYSFNLKKPDDYLVDGYFINRGWSWGWATWKDRWESVDWKVRDYKIFISNKKARREFNKGGSDLTGMLQKQMEGKLDSWAIRWFYSQYKQKKFTYYPVYSKVFNSGFDNFATHTKGSGRRYLPALDEKLSETFVYPNKAEIDKLFQRKFCRKMSKAARAISKIENLIKRYK